MPQYTIYETNHPDGTAHGSIVIIIKNSIKHYELPKFEQAHIQATSIMVDDWNGPISISAIYCPPKHNIKEQQFTTYFDTLGAHLVRGDYNAKNQQWGSHNHQRKRAPQSNKSQKINYLSTGQLTYRPIDRRKVPDVIDFCVTKRIPENYLRIDSYLDLSLDHSSIIVILSSQVL